MDVSKVVDYWLSEAKQDRRVAQSLVEKRHYRHCLFFLHLSIEKRLKAHVVRKTGKQAPFLHDLIALARRAEIELSDEQEEFLDRLTRYNRISRYPAIQSRRPNQNKSEKM